MRYILPMVRLRLAGPLFLTTQTTHSLNPSSSSILHPYDIRIAARFIMTKNTVPLLRNKKATNPTPINHTGGLRGNDVTHRAYGVPAELCMRHEGPGSREREPALHAEFDPLGTLGKPDLDTSTQSVSRFVAQDHEGRTTVKRTDLTILQERPEVRFVLWFETTPGAGAMLYLTQIMRQIPVDLFQGQFGCSSSHHTDLAADMNVAFLPT